MTLSEIVDHVCRKLKRMDEESKAEARAYTITQHRIIHDSRPWRDLRDIADLRGTVLLDSVGSPILDSEGSAISTGIGGQIVILPSIVGRVFACRWGAWTNIEVEELQTLFRINAEVFNTVGTPTSMSVISPSATHTFPGGRKLVMQSSNANARYTVSVRGRYFDSDQSERLEITSTAPLTSQYYYDEIYSLSKDKQDHDLIVKDDLGGALLTLPAAETQRFHQRIHFHATPPESGTILIFYKRSCRDLFYDSDSPEIQGIDAAVIAAVTKEMREGERQFSKASMKAQEAAGLMQVAVELEGQQANFPRIIPEVYSMTDEDCDMRKDGAW